MNTFGEATIVPLDLSENQFHIYNRISRNYSHSFLFESLTGPETLAETSIMGFDPKMILEVYADRVEITSRDDDAKSIQTKDPFEVLRSCLSTEIPDTVTASNAPATATTAAAMQDDVQHYRYVGGAVGMVDYDAIRMIEDIPDSNGAQQPFMEFAIYDDGILYDNLRKKPFYFYRDRNRFADLEIGDGTFEKFYASDTTPNINQKEFSDMVIKAKEYIYKGDIFQAVLSRRFEFDVKGDTLSLYKTLRELNPSPYMYHLKHNQRTIIGASPEMLVRITGGTVETFPIAGTRKVTGNSLEDARLAQELLADEKEIAEHTMLVDLGRNDIGRVCRFGTVHPKSLMEIKQFSHVQHIVTHLAGDIAEDKDMFDAFAAVFPAGTVSGAPKVRAMEIIDELESDARGAYAGAVGYFSYNGCCDFAIAIRSIFINGHKGFVQSGAGIVYDSIPEYEFKETEHKAGAMLQALREASS